ncbi:MAG: UDP-3-O-(3-hydroxymyristoyl)glucosamine N-acyltransferase [Pseudomonadales bacterium]
MAKPNYTLGQLAELLDAECVGDAEVVISGLATLASAGEGRLSFLANLRYQKALATTSASAVIVSPEMVDVCPVHCLVSLNPYLTYAKASQLFAVRQGKGAGIHPTAVVSQTACVDASATIGPHASIGDNGVIGANTVIGPGCVIGDDSSVGKDCLLHANVSIYHGVNMGDRAIIHSAVVIGSDGFGFAPSPDKKKGGWLKIAQLGGVTIGDDVEIGAGTTIDRGALDDTVIGDRVILDNQVQIAHNVELGDNTGIAGCSAIAGSTKIGKNCTIAGAVGIIGHLTITDNVHITVRSLVTKSINKSGSYSSGTPMQETRTWKKNAVRFSQLDALVKRVAELEKKLS